MEWHARSRTQPDPRVAAIEAFERAGLRLVDDEP